MYRQKYLFHSQDQAGEADVYVRAEDLYTREKGYGFITGQNMGQDGDLLLPELNGGFLPVPWHHMLEIPSIGQNKYGCAIGRNDSLGDGAGQSSASANTSGEMLRQIPLRFKCKVPSDGSYRIKVMVRSEVEMSDIRIFTGRRCLAAYQDKLPAGEIFCQEAAVEVCGIIPRGQEQVYDGKCVEVTVTADCPCISEITIESAAGPVLYIAGDSTVADQPAEYPYAPQTSYAGWGQMMPYFIKGSLPVSNHAHSGLTTESFRQEGHAAIPMGRVKAGDYMLFQFGHNDQKLMHLKAREGYLANLERYVSECRGKGAYPLLVTPVARNSWRGNDGAYNDLLKEYADVCLELGSRLEIPVLDLHRLSMEFILDLQKEGAKKYFYPSDYTHHNDFGAQQMAAMVCREIKRTCMKWNGTGEAGYRWLAGQIKDDPVLWDDPVCMKLLKSPDGFYVENSPEEFKEPDRPLDLLLRAEALDMVIRRAGFFNTNVYNDLFTDIVGHEWYAGVVECGLQNGIVVEKMCPGRKFRPLDAVTRLEFLVFLIMAYGSRRTLPERKPCPYDSLVDGPYQEILSSACQLGILAPDGSDELNGCISRKEGARICWSLKIM